MRGSLLRGDASSSLASRTAIANRRKVWVGLVKQIKEGVVIIVAIPTLSMIFQLRARTPSCYTSIESSFAPLSCEMTFLIPRCMSS